jgi:hypothetical protein
MADLAPELTLYLLLLPIDLWRCAQAYALRARDVAVLVSQGGRLLCMVALVSMPLLTS